MFSKTILIAAKRPRDVGAIVSYYGHMQNPNAPEPDQVFRVAPEVQALTALSGAAATTESKQASTP